MSRLLAVALFLALAAPATALSIKQLPGTQGCFYMRHDSDNCKRTNGMQGANDVAVAPDGRNVYAVSGFEDYGALLSFSRKGATGALTALPGHHGCISNDTRNAQSDLDAKHGIGLKGKCAKGRGLAEATGLTISSDGKTIYVVGTAGFRHDGDSLAVFRRDPATGFVKEIQCWTRLKSAGCTRAPMNDSPETVLLTPDSKELIVGGESITTFAVGDDGTLSAPQCQFVVGGLPASLNDCGKSSPIDKRLLGVRALASSPDGATIYDAAGDFGDGQLVALSRAADTGALTFESCIGDPAASCTAGRAVGSPNDVAVAPDGTGIYTASANIEDREGAADILHSSALISFTASPLAQLAGPVGCTVYEGRDALDCQRNRGLYEPQTLAVTPDGNHAIAGFIDSAAVLVLDRDPTTQQLTPVAGKPGCVRALHEWVDHKVTTPCRAGHGLYAPLSVAISSDGANAYLASDDGLAVFSLS